MDSDSCQKCEQPFFWNIKQMWDTKTLGLRQVCCRIVPLLRMCLYHDLYYQRKECFWVRREIFFFFFFLCRSTTAGNAVRQFVESAAPNIQPTPSWALSFRCGCVMTATARSKRKSKYLKTSLPPQFFLYTPRTMFETLPAVFMCVVFLAVEYLWLCSMKGSTT